MPEGVGTAPGRRTALGKPAGAAERLPGGSSWLPHHHGYKRSPRQAPARWQRSNGICSRDGADVLPRCKCVCFQHSDQSCGLTFISPRALEERMTRIFQRVFVTGGAGYCGSRLVPQLLKRGYQVTVYDLMYFGSHFLPKHPLLQVIEGDIRNTRKLSAADGGQDRKSVLLCNCIDGSVGHFIKILPPLH